MPDDLTVIEPEVHAAQGQSGTWTGSVVSGGTSPATDSQTPTDTTVSTAAPAPWWGSLPADLQQAKTLQRYKGVPDLAKAYINLEQRLSRSAPIPGPEATEEERTAFARRMGVPETPDGYGVEIEVPEGIPWDKNIEKEFHGIAHSLHLTPAQVEGVERFYTGMLQRGVMLTQQEMQQQQRQGIQELQQRWGPNTDRFVANAQSLVANYGDQEFVNYLEQTGLGNHPSMVSFLAKINEKFIEDSILPPETLTTGPDSARQKIVEIQQKKDHPYWDRESPDHQRALDEMSRLYKIAYNTP